MTQMSIAVTPNHLQKTQLSQYFHHHHFQILQKMRQSLYLLFQHQPFMELIQILNTLMFTLTLKRVEVAVTETSLIQTMISRLRITKEKRTTLRAKAKIAHVTQEIGSQERLKSTNLSKRLLNPFLSNNKFLMKHTSRDSVLPIQNHMKISFQRALPWLVMKLIKFINTASLTELNGREIETPTSQHHLTTPLQRVLLIQQLMLLTSDSKKMTTSIAEMETIGTMFG